MGTDYPSNKEERMAVIKRVSITTLRKIRGRRRLAATCLVEKASK